VAEVEFIIALTEHRVFGTVFVPYLIEREEQFYRVKYHVKPREFKTETDYQFKPWEKELVEIIDRFSDEKLKRKFSREKSAKDFYASLQPAYFQKHILPFIEQCMYRAVVILMLSPVRLINKDAKYANLYDEDEIAVQPLFASPVFYFERTETETRYRLKIFLENREIPLLNRQTRVVTNEPCMFVQQGKLYIFEKLNAKRLAPFFEKEEVTISRQIEDKYYPGFVLNTIRDFTVHAKGFTISQETAQRKAVLSLEMNLRNEPCLVLYFQYGDENFLANANRTVSVKVKKQDGTWYFNKVNRDFDWEEQVKQQLLNVGLKSMEGYYTLPSLDSLETGSAVYAMVSWINKNGGELGRNNISIIQDKLNKKYFTGPCNLNLKTITIGDWFDIQVSVQFGEFIIRFIKLRKYILNGIREFLLPNGEVAVLPEEWFSRFQGLLPLARVKGDNLQFEKHHFLLLKTLLEDPVKSTIEKLMEQNNQEKTGLPAGLNASLRSYQEEGFRWMAGLHENGFGGCLADDMGLGKTLQTLSLLLKLKRAKREIVIPTAGRNGQLDLFALAPAATEEQPASLVVLPTSLVHNWANEIRKFTPALNVFLYTGMQRKKATDLKKLASYYDVIITTYGTMRNDIGEISKVGFFYVILDESQFVKNPASKTYKAVMQLQAKHRLVLTGTPIENSLSDLWAQMNFLNPGLLGNFPYFQKMFISPIEKHNDQEQQKTLQMLISPYILRRKKEEVARELPPLTEHVVYCAMAAEQEKMYEEEKSIIRNAILENIEKKGVRKSSFVVLQGLTKLRQLANHPSLLDSDSEEVSGKFEQMLLMLSDLVAEKHKVLIFSSFVTHLKLIEESIEQQNWRYSLLTGKTTDRESVISQFQNDPQNFIFLISLKAGGVGLNLTAAEYVFITDPWWNPAAENQAISRAHRIGQQNNVFVYRFITENSIEEKIQALKERKSALADKFVNSNNPFAEITRDEIVELFK
jgi:superfamily II DNA or RNA helicase